jgi:hypothetical protein
MEISGPGADREVAPMLAAAERLVSEGKVVSAVEDCIGHLE